MILRFTLAFSALALAVAASAQVGAVSYYGSVGFPTGTQIYGGTTVGGLSGIDYDRASGTFYVDSDDRGEGGGPYGRYYTAKIDVSAPLLKVTLDGVHTNKTPSGGAFGAAGIDPESIRYRNGQVWIASEGDVVPTAQNPFVRAYDAAGNQVRDLAVPNKFLPGTAGRGIRDNLAFESLAFSTDGKSLYTATEGALMQDGPAASFGVGTTSRVLQFDLASGTTKEFAYNVDPLAVAASGASPFGVSGLTELLAVDATHLLALERSFSTGSGNTVKLYEMDLSGATDVSGLDSLVGATYTAASKRLLFNFNTGIGMGLSPSRLDNLEGMTWGPTLSDGSRSLIFVSDDNFDLTNTVGTQFFALKVAAVPEPATLAAFGLGAAALLRRRRK